MSTHPDQQRRSAQGRLPAQFDDWRTMMETNIATLTIWWIANLPPHLNINRLELMPTSQSFAGFQIARDA